MVHALCIWALNLKGGQALCRCRARQPCKGYPFKDQDKIGACIADVPIIVSRGLKRKRGFENSVSVDLKEIHTLFVNRTAHAICHNLAFHREWNLGEELGVKVGIGLLIPHMEKASAPIVPRINFDIAVYYESRHPVGLIQSARSMERFRKPSWPPAL